MRISHVTRTPAGWLGTIAEAAFGTCGRSVIVGDLWYRFSRKRGFVASDARLAERPEHCIEVVGETTLHDAAYLDGLVGSRWRPWHNCVTAFSPVWRRGMSVMSAGDRDAVSRRVVLSLVAALVLAVAVVGGGHLYVQSQVDHLKRSCAAQFGQVTKALRELGAPPR
jgi:hypothetical protein